MANNRKSKSMINVSARKTQIVYSEAQKLFKEKYLSPKGKRLFAKSKKDLIWKLYGKNRYTVNPNAKPVTISVMRHGIMVQRVKVIKHKNN